MRLFEDNHNQFANQQLSELKTELRRLLTCDGMSQDTRNDAEDLLWRMGEDGEEIDENHLLLIGQHLIKQIEADSVLVEYWERRLAEKKARAQRIMYRQIERQKMIRRQQSQNDNQPQE